MEILTYLRSYTIITPLVILYMFSGFLLHLYSSVVPPICYFRLRRTLTSWTLFLTSLTSSSLCPFSFQERILSQNKVFRGHISVSVQNSYLIFIKTGDGGEGGWVDGYVGSSVFILLDKVSNDAPPSFVQKDLRTIEVSSEVYLKTR